MSFARTPADPLLDVEAEEERIYNRPHVREVLDDDSKVVLRFGGTVIRMSVIDAADLAVRILNVKARYLALDGKMWPDTGRPAMAVSVDDDLPRRGLPNQHGAYPYPQIRSGAPGTPHVQVHIGTKFRDTGAFEARRAIRAAFEDQPLP